MGLFPGMGMCLDCLICYIRKLEKSKIAVSGFFLVGVHGIHDGKGHPDFISGGNIVPGIIIPSAKRTPSASGEQAVYRSTAHEIHNPHQYQSTVRCRSTAEMSVALP